MALVEKKDAMQYPVSNLIILIHPFVTILGRSLSNAHEL